MEMAAFVERAKAVYDADAKTIDFQQPGAADIINQWVSDKTKARIPQIVTPDSIKTAVAMITNAVYFMGRWQYEFPEAETAYFRSLVEYQLALKNIQFEKGTLLEYNQVHLNEGSWPDKAYEDAEVRESRRGQALPDTERNQSQRLSQGVYPQMLAPGSAPPTGLFGPGNVMGSPPEFRPGNGATNSAVPGLLATPPTKTNYGSAEVLMTP